MSNDNLNDPEMASILRRLRALETAASAGFSSITRGALRVASPEGLLVEGSEKVTGVLEVVGILLANGTLHTLSITGDTTLLANLIIGTGGKITVGAVTVDPGAGGTGGLSSTSAIRLASPQVFTTADLNVGDDLTVSDVLAVLGVIINNGMTAQTNAANVYVNPTTKQFYLVSSSLRFKIDPQPMNLPDALLDVPVKDWIDKAAAERYAELLEHPRPLTEFEQLEMDDGASLRRVPGIIAEEVAAAGGEPFVTYDAEGEIAGVAYDRLALARTQILARRLDAALERIHDLEERLTS